MAEYLKGSGFRNPPANLPCRSQPPHSASAYGERSGMRRRGGNREASNARRAAEEGESPKKSKRIFPFDLKPILVGLFS